MKMNLIEMEGFLRGKCLPGDMLVNETNAQYLVRKFSELESKCAALAAELEAAEKRVAEVRGYNVDLAEESRQYQQRVSELEARVVVLPQRISMEGGAYCTAHARYDEDGDFYYRDEVIESLVAAGIISKAGE